MGLNARCAQIDLPGLSSLSQRVSKHQQQQTLTTNNYQENYFPRENGSNSSQTTQAKQEQL